MTNDELDEARAKEAYRLAHIGREVGDNTGMFREVGCIAARLARENWQPTDPDLVLAREVVAKVFEDQGQRGCAPTDVRAGVWDGNNTVVIALAAIRAARREAG